MTGWSSSIGANQGTSVSPTLQAVVAIDAAIRPFGQLPWRAT